MTPQESLRTPSTPRRRTTEAGASAEAETGFYDRELGSQVVKILPGEYLATSRDLLLVTLLGSCIAVCLGDPLAGIGGMNHFMLPDGTLANVASGPARYGAYAMELLLNDLLKRGARRDRLQAKVFGGGNVLASLGASTVGARNTAFIRAYLERERIAVVGEDVLGHQPRKVAYSPRTGEALMRRLPHARGEVVLAEAGYRSALRRVPDAGHGTELF